MAKGTFADAIKNPNRLPKVAYTYNHSYSRGWRLEAGPGWGKLSDTISPYNPGVVVHACNLSYKGDIGRKAEAQGWCWVKKKNKILPEK
jgi:hypothetical protein